MASLSIFVKDFTALDYAFVDKNLGTAGMSHFVSAEIIGCPDNKDFILDFRKAKNILKNFIDSEFDHKLIIPEKSKFVKLNDSYLKINTTSGETWNYHCPNSAIKLLPESEVTVLALELHLGKGANMLMPTNVSEVKIQLRSLPVNPFQASFHYTHGLRLHDGNCQRLLHGHHSPIEVWINDERAQYWENLLAEKWENAHFASSHSIRSKIEESFPVGEKQPSLQGNVEIEYTGSQGKFLASIPANRLIVTADEPTIETMAPMAADVLRSNGLKSQFRVVAYEGLSKGASFIAL